MTVYKKLADARLKLQNAGLKKTGRNKFAGYDYFELQDFLPTINKINAELGLCTIVSFNQELAVLKVINSDKPEESIEICSPMESAKLKGCHDIQNLGAVESYQRRYLYMAAYEIAENDLLDSVTGSNENKSHNSNKGKPTGKLSEAQVKRLYAIANSAGYGSDVVKKQMSQKYKITSAELLSKSQYDELCAGYEKLQKEAK